MRKLSTGMILWLTISAVGLFGLWADDHFGILLKIILTVFIVCSCILLVLLDLAEGLDDCMCDEDYGDDYLPEDNSVDLEMPEEFTVVHTRVVHDDILWGDVRP